MDITPIKVDFLGGESERKARRTTAILAIVFAVAVGTLAAVGAGASYRAVQHGTSVLDEVANLPIIAEIRRLAWGETPTAPVPDGRMTFLVLGVGGAGHDGPELTDTILLMTADLNANRLGILSIPRDLAYPLGGGKFVKINSLNAYAEQSNPGNGARETANTFEDLLGIRIDHVVKIDFKAFEDIIDAVGGVDVNVERSFIDREYPTNDDKWQMVSFEAGKQHMDGATALKFVRSRHGSNGEGSDFARAKRQQLVILALKSELLSKGTLTNPSRLLKLYEAVATNIQTDLSAWDAIKLAPLAKNFSSDRITSHVLETGKTGELTSALVDGSYLLFPRDQDWSQIRSIAQNPFGETQTSTTGTPAVPKKPANIEVRNGTRIPGYASRFAETLKSRGYSVETIGNASARGYDKSVIYDLTNGARSEDLTKLKNLLDANVAPSFPAWTSSSASGTTEGESAPADPDHTDFLIILGASSSRLLNEKP